MLSPCLLIPSKPLFLAPLRIPGGGPVGLASNATLLAGAGQTFSAGNKCSLVGEAMVDPGTGDFSVEFWLNPSALADYAGIITTGARGNGEDGFTLRAMANGSLSLAINDSVQGTRTIGTVCAAGALVIGTWVHVVLVCDRNGNATAYIDGVPSGVTMDISGHQETLGARVNVTLAAYSGYYLAGTLCCVRYWPTLLTEDDARVLFNRRNPMPYGQLSDAYKAKLGLKGHNWNLDEPSVGDPTYVSGANLTVRDQHNGNDLTFTPENMFTSNYDFETGGGSTGTVSGTYVTKRARSGDVATITTSTNHGLINDSVATIASMSNASYDASSVSVTKVSDTVFTYANVGADEGEAAESAGRVTVTVFSGYGVVTSNGTVARTSYGEHGGSYACKLTRLVASGNSPNLYHGATQRPTVVPGHTYRHSVWCRGDGTHQPYLAFYDVTNSAYIGSTARPTGISGTSWANSNITFAAPAGCVSIYVVYRGGASADAVGAVTYFDDSALYATHLTAANGPYGAIASDRVGDNHLTLQGRDRVAEITDWRTSGPHGSFTTAVKNSGSLGAGFNGAMTGFTDVDAARISDVPSGRSGHSILFDGTSDWVSVPDPGESTTTLTACLWFKAAANPSAASAVFGHYDKNAQRAWTISIDTTGGVYTSVVSDGNAPSSSNAKTYASASVYTDNQWHHAAFTWNSGVLTLYVDAIAVSVTKSYDADITECHNSTAPVSIGGNLSSGSFRKGMNASLYDARVYNSVLSKADILAVKNNTYSATTPVLKMIDGTDTPRSVANLSGVGSLNHDGSDDAESLTTQPLSNGNVTFCAWMKPRTIGETTGRLFDNGKFAIGCYTNRSIFSFSDGVSTAYSGNDAAPYGLWTHVAVTRTNAGVTNFYSNGALSGTANQDGGTPNAGTTAPTIGNKADGSRAFDGLLADIRVYNSILTPAQIAELYSGSEATGATPTARWDFSDGAPGSPSQYDPIVSWVTGDDARSQLYQTTFTAQPFADYTKLGGSLGACFDGIDDYLSTTTIPFAFGQEGSIWCLIATNGTLATDQTILSFNDTASAGRYLRVFIPANTRHLAIGVRNNDTEDILETDLSVRDTGSTFAVICNGTTTAIYVDGKLAVLTQTSGTGQSRWLDDVTGEDNLVLGAQVTSGGATKFFKGHVYAWAVTPRVLILSEVWGLANWARQFGVTKQ